ncbi:uncharacterized protein LOC114525354, partial [Dendronephthya gigantea]|uniref:uncharacterized protein LOC114525354 n=1 Tax=Dendronephthya gigantea TaxID=151771 RepID=UPI001069822C
HGQIDSLGVIYDYGSVMHYPRRAFSGNGRDTIVPRKPGVEIGQRSRLSGKDALQANLMYQCLSTIVPPQSSTIPPPENSAPEGFIMHLQSKKCFYPAGDKVEGENHPVVLYKCDKHTGRFRMYENGTIQHVLSGMCVHPNGDCLPPEDGTELVLSKSCGGRTRSFLINLDGLLIHSSKTCVRPAHHSERVPDNTRVVIYRTCSASKFAFAFTALPRTNKKNLALGKPAGQRSTYKQGVASKAVDGKRNGNYYEGFCSHTLRSTQPWWMLDFGKKERVEAVYVSNRADCCWWRLSGFEIRVGDKKNIAENPQCGTKHSLKRGETREILCRPPLEGRFISISMVQRSRGTFLTLCEVAVYEPSTKSPTKKPPKPGRRTIKRNKLVFMTTRVFLY